MKVVIMAAGRSSRLLPLTKDIPQCLLKFNNKTILEHQLDIIKKSEISDVDVICGYLAGDVEKFCKEKNINTIFNPFYDVSGMGMTLWVASDALKDGFISIYSDILFESDVISGMMGVKHDIVLVVKRGNLRAEAEKVVTDNNVIKKIGKVSDNNWNAEFIGISKFSKNGSKKLLDEIHKMSKQTIDISFIAVIKKLIDDGEIIGFYDVSDGKFIDIDFPDDLKRAEKLF
jgi:L-glutamine-phosphate cytidylyltransferase